ncbi:MAG: flagellar biosynthetic protein FliO [Solimonas sp.]
MQMSDSMAPVPAVTAHVAAAPQAIGAAGVGGVLLSLAAVVALILALGWLARRLQQMRGARGGSLQVLGGVSVGSKERVVMLQVGYDHFLVGVAPGCVSLLHRFMAAPVAGQGEAEAEAPAAASAVVVPFADKLRELLRKQNVA